MIIPCRRIYRDERNDLTAYFHVNLIDTVAQIHIVFREHTVFFKQILCKSCFPRFLLRISVFLVLRLCLPDCSHQIIQCSRTPLLDFSRMCVRNEDHGIKSR